MDRAQPFPLRTKFRLQQGRWDYNLAFRLTLCPPSHRHGYVFSAFFPLREARVCQC